MRKVDFVLVYEHKVREMYSLILLKAELEHRGYTVEIMGCLENSHVPRPLVKCEVLFLPGGVNYMTHNYYAGSYVKYKKVVNLPREQIFNSNLGQEWGMVHSIGNEFKYCVWGENFREILTEIYGCNKDNVYITGNVELDLCKPVFNSVYPNREYFSKKYDLDTKKKWILFVSSFSMVGYSDDEIEEMSVLTNQNHLKDFCEESTKTFDIIERWLRNLANSRDDVIVIYRPHPSEIKNTRLNEIKSDKFRVIGDEPMKNWLRVCDNIYTQVSTGIVEMYCMGKKVGILRPIAINEEWDIPLYVGCKAVDNEEEFIKSLDATNADFPISENLISKYVDKIEDMAYTKVVDVFEQIYHSNYKISTKELINYKRWQFNNAKGIKGKAYYMLTKIPGMYDLYRKLRTIRKRPLWDASESDCWNQAEADDIQKKIEVCLYGE